MNVKTTFVNRNLEEDVYMVQSPDFEDPSNGSKVCKLQRSIYGLKQTSRSWNKRFDKEVNVRHFFARSAPPLGAMECGRRTWRSLLNVYLFNTD
jgi:Reverse transcriptase (RNA-dependent DNA polymerase)